MKKRKLRIAIFSDNFYPEISGVSDSIIETAKGLANLGHKIIFFVPEYSNKNYKELNLKNKELNLGKNIKIIRLPSLQFKFGKNQGRVVLPRGAAIEPLRKFNPDVIHVHHSSGLGVEGLFGKRSLNVPLIGTNHTAMKEFMNSSSVKSKYIKKLILDYNHWFYNKCNLVSSPAGYILKGSKIKTESMVIPNPIDLKIFKKTKQRKKEYGLSNFVIVHAGRIAPEKHIDLIIKAVAKLKDKIPEINLAIVGQGSMEEELKQLAKSLNVQNIVKFIGFLPPKKLSEVYNSSEVFVIMSSAETQSLVTMQAMACGLPIIAASSAGLKEYINRKNGILVGIGNVNDLAKEILVLYKDPKKRKDIISGGLEFVKKLSRENIAKKWENVYQKCSRQNN